MHPPIIVPIERLDFRLVKWDWPFAAENRERIAAHFSDVRREKPTIWNGRVYIVRHHEISGTTLRGEFFETGFAELLAWRDWGYPDPKIDTAFSLAAIQSAQNSFLLGVMGSHTANAGKVYFPTGTPDADDLDGEIVDLDRSVRRELGEETGLSFDEFEVRPNWYAVFSGRHIALVKWLRSRDSETALAARVRRFLAKDSEPEFSDIRFAASAGDLTPEVPPYVRAFLELAWREGG